MLKEKRIKPKHDHIPLPEVFELEPTNKCNIKCKMCHVSYMENEKIEFFDISLLPRLNSLKGKWVTVGSTFEPAIHKQFVKIIQYLSEMDCKIVLTTNGTMFTEKVIKPLSDCASHIKRVTISFDSIKKETYESIRKESKFESAIEKVLSCRAGFMNTDSYFTSNIVLMQSNIEELIDMINFWETHGFHHIGFIFMVIRDANEKLLNETIYPIREYAFKKLDEAAKYVIENNLKITISSPYFQHSTLKDSFPNNVIEHIIKSNNKEARMPFQPIAYFQKGKYQGMPVNCKSPFTFAKILWNGDVQMCYRYIIGNLNEQDFKDIWYGEKTQQVRENIMANPAICYGCDYFRFCINNKDIDINDGINYFQQDLIELSKQIDFDAEVIKFPVQDNPAQIKLIEEGYKEFNIISYKGQFFGLAQDEGAFDTNKIKSKEYQRCFAGNSIEEVKQLIDKPSYS